MRRHARCDEDCLASFFSSKCASIVFHQLAERGSIILQPRSAGTICRPEISPRAQQRAASIPTARSEASFGESDTARCLLGSRRFALLFSVQRAYWTGASEDRNGTTPHMGDQPSLHASSKWLDSFGLSTRQRRLLWGTLAAFATYYTARRLLGPRKKQERSTDFDSFLAETVQPKSRSHTQPQPAACSFDAFLKERKPVPAKTDFNAFLRTADPTEQQEETASTSAKAVSGPKDDQVVISVLYGTEYGFAQEIAGKLCEMLTETNKYWPRQMNMADYPDGMPLSQEQVLLVICSTQGDGVPPSEARSFCDWLNSPSAEVLPSTHYSVCALGDTSYQHFCACGKQIDARLASLEAQQFVPRRDVNKEDWEAINSWLRLVIDSLALLKLESVEECGYVLENGGPEQTQRISKARPLLAEVVAIEGLCTVSQAGDKDTIRVEIHLGDSGLEYTPGDALGIYASNAPEVVEDLLNFTGADAKELYQLPAWLYSDEARPPGSQISLRELLTHCYDLRSPKAELLQLLLDNMPVQGVSPKAEKKAKNGYSLHCHSLMQNGTGKLQPNASENGDQKQGIMQTAPQVNRLKELLAGPESDREAFFQPRHVIDVLQDFALASLPLDSLLSSLRPLLPRLYSISSSPCENPARVQVTVATVRYTSLEKERLGVASTFLAERIMVGEKLPVYVFRNPDFRLPPDPATPIVMVGPGTGLAPFRAFILERIGTGRPFGASLLFFGCRRRDQDFLYGKLLEEWAAEGHIELHTAFSREKEHKVYVQDRLREQSSRVWQLLETGGHFYVCGDAAHMASAVEQALLQIISSNQGKGQEAAHAYLEMLQRKERYQRDVWF